MKRDLTVIQQVLEYVEEREESSVYVVEINNDGVDTSVLRYHIDLCVQAGLLGYAGSGEYAINTADTL